MQWPALSVDRRRHLNNFEDYTTKSYMGYLESKMIAEWDVNGPLKHVTKQILESTQSSPGNQQTMTYQSPKSNQP